MGKIMGYSEMQKTIVDSMTKWNYRITRFVYCFLAGAGVIGETGDGKHD